MAVPFTVLTANIAGQEWMKFNERKDVAQEVFGRQTADLIGFQEMSSGNWREVFHPVRPDLALASGRDVGEIVINSFAYSLARFRLLIHDTFWLSPDCTYMKSWDGAERGATWGHLVDRKTSREFIFINTHLDNKGVVARIESVKLILEFVKQLGDMPIVLTADSNVSIHSPVEERWGAAEMRRPYEMMLEAGFVDAWTATHHGERRPFTYHAFRGKDYDVRTHDEWGTYDTEWILTKGPLVPVSSRLVMDSVKGKYPSDHYWMEAKIQWK